PGAASAQVSALLQGLGLTPGCSDNIPRNRTVCSVATNGMRLESVDVTMLLDYRMAGDIRLTSTTSWDRYRVLRIEDDAIQLFAPMLFYRDAEKSPSIQEEIRLASSDAGPLSWQLGG